MHCRLCVVLSDSCVNFDGVPMETLVMHSKIHQSQMDLITEGKSKTGSWKWNMVKRCFPNVNDCTNDKSMNVEAEIAGRRRRHVPNNTKDENGGGSKKKRFRGNLEGAKEENERNESLLNEEPPAPTKCGAVLPECTEQQRIKSSGIRIRGIAVIRRYCRELNSKFGQNGKLTCHQCSRDMVVARGISSAVDHVLRSHFGQTLFECRLCSKRTSAYTDMAQHVSGVHRKSMADGCIDLSEQHENEIMESMTKCYGAPATCEKSGTTSKQHTRKQRAMKAHSHGFAACRSYCNELRKKFSQNGKLTCLQCSTKLVVETNAKAAVDHVTRCHFSRKLFACRLCSKGCNSYSALADHGRLDHPASPADTYIDLSEKDKNEIIELMTKCYGAAQIVEDGNGNQTGSNNRITFAIRNCYRELKKKFGRDGKLACCICHKRKFRADLFGTVSHVGRIHVRKSLFTCRLCSKGFLGFSGVTKHILKIHGLHATGNYNAHTEQYEEEIIEAMKTCFGEEKKTDEEEQTGRTG